MAVRSVAKAVTSGLRRGIRDGRWEAGDVLPSYVTLGEAFGASPKSVMKAVATLEHEGVLTRQSPRRIIVAEQAARRDTRPVGLMGFEGHLWEDIAHMLVRRLYDRQVDAALLNPVHDTEPALRRWCAHFFDREYQALLVRDGSDFPVHVFDDYADRIDKLILVHGAFNQWHLPHYGVFTDLAFMAADGLNRLHRAGCRRVWMLGGDHSPPGSMHPRDRLMTGVDRFLAAHDDVLLLWENPYDLADHARRRQRWGAAVRPGDGVFAVADYWIVKAQEWLADRERLATCRFLGRGNTPWSQHGPHRFASYDFRLEDTVEQVLAWIDGNDTEPTIRRLRPRLVRGELLERNAT